MIVTVIVNSVQREKALYVQDIHDQLLCCYLSRRNYIRLIAYKHLRVET